MRTSEPIVQVYEELAQCYDRQGQPKLRDWFLVLAADNALAAGRPDEAERLRGRLLHINPHHLLKPFDTFAEALRSSDVQRYVADLRRIYPPETARRLLQEQRHNGAAAEKAERPTHPLENSLNAGLAAAEGEVQVFRLETEPETPRPTAPPRQTAAPRPTLPPTAAPARTRAAPRRSGPLPIPGVTPALTEDEEVEAALSRWVALALFVLLLCGGVALAGYTLVWPFVADVLSL